MAELPFRRARLIDIVDEEWKQDELPSNDIPVPEDELPSHNDTDVTATDGLLDQEHRWNDIGLGDVR